MSIEEIITKLVGPINPVGQHSVDADRLQNLCTLRNAIIPLINRVTDIELLQDSHEGSVKQCAVFASEFLKELHEITNQNER